MNVLDLVLLLAVVTYAFSGYRLGFLVGASATFGLLLGGLTGILVAPAVLDPLDPSLGVSLGALVIVLLAATVGQAVGGLLGTALRSAVTWRPARVLDAVGGAALSMVAVLVIAWALGFAVSGASIPWLGSQARGSEVLSVVDHAMPDSADDVLNTVRRRGRERDLPALPAAVRARADQAGAFAGCRSRTRRRHPPGRTQRGQGARARPPSATAAWRGRASSTRPVG